MRAAAIVVAAGRGVRAGGGVPKQYRALAGRPVLAWSLAALADLERVVIVRDSGDDALLRAIPEAAGAVWAEGGETRLASVRAGFAALAADPPDAVFVHDAARPGLRPADLTPLLEALARFDAVAPALPAADALKRVDGDAVLHEENRAGLVRVQTPQAVRYAPFARALAAWPGDAPADDELAIARAAGLAVGVTPGAARLAKLTTVEDLAMLERLLAPAITPVCGTGFDAHRFGPGDHVTLCGVPLPHEFGLLGHSDADAAWHALTDAILGAIGQGDIGDHFPPSEARWRGADSGVFLAHARDLVRAVGGRIANVDVTVICERPKVKPHREAMRARTAEVLGLPLARVSVKATTTEEMGFPGRREGIAAMASAMILLPGDASDVS